jgi:hypothetical protein
MSNTIFKRRLPWLHWLFAIFARLQQNFVERVKNQKESASGRNKILR